MVLLVFVVDRDTLLLARGVLQRGVAGIRGAVVVRACGTPVSAEAIPARGIRSRQRGSFVQTGTINTSRSLLAPARKRAVSPTRALSLPCL